jgi:hypothetical protein
MGIDLNGNKIYSTSIGPEGEAIKRIITDGLVMHLDAGNKNSYSGTGTSWYDLTSYGNNATSFFNSPTFDSTTGGGSMNFVGSSSQYIQIPHSTSLNISSTITTGNWVYYISGNGRIMQKDDLNLGNNYTRLWETGGYGGVFRLELWHSDGTTVGAPSANALTTNGWMYINMIFDGTNVYHYQNGSLTKTTSFPGDIRTGSSPVTIAGGWNGEFFTGKIATATIYNRALSATEIAQNFNAQKARFGL